MRKFFGILLVASLATHASAQFSIEGGTDIIIDAEKATYKGRHTILEGSVDVRQGEAQILSDIMHIYRAAAETTSVGSVSQMGEVTRIEAEGNFSYKTPENTVIGDRGVYERSTGIIIVTGNVSLIQPSGSRVNGTRLTYNVNTKSARFGESCQGEGCSGRVTFSVQQQD